MASFGNNGGGGYQQQQQYTAMASSDVSRPPHMFWQKPRANVIEDPHEGTFFEDGRVRYTAKVCKINSVPKVGFTRFYYVNQLGKYLPGAGCFMSVPGWIAFTQNTQLQEELMSRAKAMQKQCMCNT